MTEQERAEIHALVDELDALIDSGGPRAKAAWLKLKRLAETTGDEYEAVARQLLAERASGSAEGAP